MSSFNDFINDVEELEEELDEIISEFLDKKATECVAETQSRTPVKSGTLRRSWTHSNVNKDGDIFSIEIGSSIPYAEAVEEGHKQEVGRYVPAIGKKLKKSFVSGRHMLRDSLIVTEKEIDEELPMVIDKVFKRWI